MLHIFILSVCLKCIWLNWIVKWNLIYLLVEIWCHILFCSTEQKFMLSFIIAVNMNGIALWVFKIKRNNLFVMCHVEIFSTETDLTCIFIVFPNINNKWMWCIQFEKFVNSILYRYEIFYQTSDWTFQVNLEISVIM